MLFEIKNCIIREVTDVKSGTSRSGNAWTKATVVVEKKDGDYTDTVAMEAFGDDRITAAQGNTGTAVDVKFFVQGREFNGRWYNDLRFMYVSPVQAAKPAQATKPAPAPAPAQEDDPNGDLPL